MTTRQAVTSIDHRIDGLFVHEVRPDPGPLHKAPLLLLHGGMHGWWAWERWQPHMASKGWRTLAMSLPGHTDSQPVDTERLLTLKLRDYADAVLRVLDWIDQPTVLIAHSMGGAVAQQVAQRRQLDRLVLVTAVGPGRGQPIRGQLPEDRPFTLTREAARAMFFHKIDDDVFEDVYQRLTPESPSVLNDYTRGGIVTSPDIGCPVLVVEAEYDRPVMAEHARDAADFYDATHARVADAGHDLMLEDVAEDVATYICSWLTDADDPQLPTVATARTPTRSLAGGPR